MAPARGSADPLNGIFKELGELVAEVRTLKHSSNNTGQKLDAVGEKIGKLETLAVTVEELVRDRDDHEMRLKHLERTDVRDEGARGVILWLLQSPVIGWLVAAALFVAAWWKGQKL